MRFPLSEAKTVLRLQRTNNSRSVVFWGVWRGLTVSGAIRKIASPITVAEIIIISKKPSRDEEARWLDECP
jgi:hypothetical protein